MSRIRTAPAESSHPIHGSHRVNRVDAWACPVAVLIRDEIVDPERRPRLVERWVVGHQFAGWLREI
jgi:hypothetical protein